MISVYSTCNSTCKQTVLHRTYILPEAKDPAEVRGKFLNKKSLVTMVLHGHGIYHKQQYFKTKTMLLVKYKIDTREGKTNKHCKTKDFIPILLLTTIHVRPKHEREKIMNTTTEQITFLCYVQNYHITIINPKLGSLLCAYPVDHDAQYTDTFT